MVYFSYMLWWFSFQEIHLVSRLSSICFLLRVEQKENRELYNLTSLMKIRDFQGRILDSLRFQISKELPDKFGRLGFPNFYHESANAKSSTWNSSSFKLFWNICDFARISDHKKLVNKMECIIHEQNSAHINIKIFNFA